MKIVPCAQFVTPYSLQSTFVHGTQREFSAGGISAAHSEVQHENKRD
jgi:hypothetical protein